MNRRDGRPEQAAVVFAAVAPHPLPADSGLRIPFHAPHRTGNTKKAIVSDRFSCSG